MIAFELAVGGTDVPMVAFLCLGFAFLWERKPVLAGLALGIGASMKATAWPALLVAIALLAVRDGKRAVGNFTLTALGVVAVCVGPFIVNHPKALVENTIMFPLGLASVKSAAQEPAPRVPHRVDLAAHRAHDRRGRCSRSPAWPSRRPSSSSRRARCRGRSYCSPGR